MTTLGRSGSESRTSNGRPMEEHQRMTSSITARSSPLALGMEMRRLASATIPSLSMRSAGPARHYCSSSHSHRPGTRRRPLRRRVRRSRLLETFEPSDVDHEHDRAADLDLEVFRHVEQTWLQSGRYGPLPAAAACTPQDPQHRLYLIVFDTDKKAGIAGAQEGAGRADLVKRCSAETSASVSAGVSSSWTMAITSFIGPLLTKPAR